MSKTLHFVDIGGGGVGAAADEDTFADLDIAARILTRERVWNNTVFYYVIDGSDDARLFCSPLAADALAALATTDATIYVPTDNETLLALDIDVDVDVGPPPVFLVDDGDEQYPFFVFRVNARRF